MRRVCRKQGVVIGWPWLTDLIWGDEVCMERFEQAIKNLVGRDTYCMLAGWEMSFAKCLVAPPQEC